MKSRKSFLNKALNAFLLFVCVFPIGLFIYRFFRKSVPILYNTVSSSILLVGGLGLLFIYNGRRIIGILLVFLNLIAFCVKGILYKQNIFGTFYFWAFLFVLVYFIVDELRGKASSKLFKPGRK